MNNIKDVKVFEDYTNTVDLSNYTEGTRIEVLAQYVKNGSIYNYYTNFLFNTGSVCRNDDIAIEYFNRSLKVIPINNSVTECIISWCTII